MSPKIIPAFISLVVLGFSTFLVLSNTLTVKAIDNTIPNQTRTKASIKNSQNFLINYLVESKINTESKQSLIYVTLDDDSQTYSLNTICINGQAYSGGLDNNPDLDNHDPEDFEKGGDQDLLPSRDHTPINISGALERGIAPYSIWVPYFSSSCSDPIPADSKFSLSSFEPRIYSLRATLKARSTGGTTIQLQNSPIKDLAANPVANIIPSNNSVGVSNQSVELETKPQPTTKKVASDLIPYALKSIYISYDKPIALDANLKISRTTISAKNSLSLRVTNVVKIDQDLKNLTCELVTSNSNNKAVATSNLTENGECTVVWNPAGAKKGKTTVRIRINDTTRDHTYSTATSTINIR